MQNNEKCKKTETIKKAFEISNAIDKLNNLLWEVYYEQFLQIMQEENNRRQICVTEDHDFPF